MAGCAEERKILVRSDAKYKKTQPARVEKFTQVLEDFPWCIRNKDQVEGSKCGKEGSGIEGVDCYALSILADDPLLVCLRGAVRQVGVNTFLKVFRKFQLKEWSTLRFSIRTCLGQMWKKG